VLNRRLASLIAAVAVAGVAATACADQSAAIRVDDVTVSRNDFEDELALYFDNADLRGFVFGQVEQDQLRGELRDSYSQEYVAAVAGLRVQFIVADSVLAAEGLEVTDEDRQAAEDLIADGVPGGVSSLPEDRRADFVDDVAAFTTLQAELQDGFTQAITDAYAEADISVRSQYGTWDPEQLTIVPPDGPVGAPGGGDAETDGPTPG
jgi:hypothetical protein